LIGDLQAFPWYIALDKSFELALKVIRNKIEAFSFALLFILSKIDFEYSLGIFKHESEVHNLEKRVTRKSNKDLQTLIHKIYKHEVCQSSWLSGSQ